MSVNNNTNLINQICIASGLHGTDLDALKSRLAQMNEAELQAELTRTLSGNNFYGDMGLKVEKSTSEKVSTEQEIQLKEALSTRLNAVSTNVKKVEDSNGFLGKAWSWAKNTFNVGDSSEKVREQQQADLKALESGNIAEAFKQITGLDYTVENVNKFLNNEVQTKSETALNGYTEGQDMASDVIADMVSGIVSVGIYTAAVAAVPFTGGASIAVGVAAAGVSAAAIKTGIKYADAKSGDREYTADNLKKDLATGAFSGVLAPITGGMGGAVGKTVATKVGIQAVKQVGKEVAEEAVEQTAKGIFKTALTNPTGYEYVGGNIVKRGIAFVAEAATDGAIGGAADNAFRAAYDGGDAEEIWDATKQGFKYGAAMAPIIGGGMKVAGKGAQKIFGKNDVNLEYSKGQEGETVVKINDAETTPKAEVNTTALEPAEVLSDELPFKIERRKSSGLFGHEEVYYNGQKLASTKRELVKLIKKSWAKTDDFYTKILCKLLKTPEDFQRASILILEGENVSSAYSQFKNVNDIQDAAIMGMLIKHKWGNDYNDANAVALAEIKENPLLYSVYDKILSEYYGSWDYELSDIKEIIRCSAPQLKTQENCDAFVDFVIDKTTKTSNKREMAKSGNIPLEKSEVDFYLKTTELREIFDLPKEDQMFIEKYIGKTHEYNIKKLIKNISNPEVKDLVIEFLNRLDVKFIEIIPRMSGLDFDKKALEKLLILDSIGIKFNPEKSSDYLDNLIKDKIVEINFEEFVSVIKQLKGDGEISLSPRDAVNYFRVKQNPRTSTAIEIFEEIITNPKFANNEALRSQYDVFLCRNVRTYFIDVMKLILSDEKLYNNINLINNLEAIADDLHYASNRWDPDYIKNFLENYIKSNSTNDAVAKNLGTLARHCDVKFFDFVMKELSVTTDELKIKALINLLDAHTGFDCNLEAAIKLRDKFLSDEKFYTNNDILENINVVFSKVTSENFDLVSKLLFESDFPKDKIASIIESSFPDFVKKLCYESKLSSEQIVFVASRLNDTNLFLAEHLCFDEKFPKEMIADILGSINPDNKYLGLELYSRKDFPNEEISSVLYNVNRSNISLARELCFNQEFPKQYIARILSKTNERNIELAHKLCLEKGFDLQLDKIPELLQTAANINIDIKTLTLSEKINMYDTITNLPKGLLSLYKEYFNVDAKLAELTMALGKKRSVIKIPLKQQRMFVKGILANNNPAVERVLKDFDFSQYGKEGLPLRYSREYFTANVKELLENLRPEERALILNHFGLVEGAAGFDGLPTNKKFESSEVSAQVREIAEKIQKEIEEFTTENRVYTDDREADEVLNSLLQGLPEFTSIVGKEQHGTHAYSVDIHTLKVLQSAMNNPLYAKLTDLDKTILKIAALCHDFGKRGGVVDNGHASSSAEYCAAILEKFEFPQGVKDRIIDIVENHHWFEAYNTGRAKASDVAVRCRRPEDFVIYEILAKADFENVNKDFHIARSEGVSTQAEFDKFMQDKMQAIDEALALIYSKANLVFDTQFVRKGEMFPRQTVEVLGEVTELKVLNFNELDDNASLQQFGFTSGVTKQSARFIVHMTDPTNGAMNSVMVLTQNSLNQSAWSTSLIKASNNRTYVNRKFGFVLDVDQANISEANYANTSSGTGKGLATFKTLLFEQGRHRTYVRDHLLKELSVKGIDLDDREYAQLTRFLITKKYTTQINKDIKIGDKVIKAKDLVDALEKSRDALFEGGNIHSEIVPINPRVKGLIAKVETLEECPPEFLAFAKKHDLPIILMKPVNEK